ncbi:MAG: hypothetical protein HQL40_12430 [Alphaproteobacteria bacterium]|nr:hypothetical protein [Alphaproteobacteria bacterium]
MKILVTIPHYYDHDSASQYGSANMDRMARVAILETMLNGLFDLFETGGGLVDWRLWDPANPIPPKLIPANIEPDVQLDVVVCTVADRHLMGCLKPALASKLTHLISEDRPLMLGFVARDVLGRKIGEYDWYCYFEDDTMPVDRMTFAKLAAATPSPGVVIMPNRYEIDPARPNRKIYADGPTWVKGGRGAADLLLATGGFEITWGGAKVRLRKVRNPHSGCFLLNAAQMRTFVASPAFRDYTPAYVGPLESAATLGILRTFDVYKPARENADFLDVHHLGGTVIKRLGL